MNQPTHSYFQPVLVVEDNPEDFDTVREAAQRDGLRNRLVHAASADQARALLAETAQAPYAFMLLDCSLPGEDGLTLLQELRRDPAHQALPVIVLTASLNPRERNAFYAAGANAYHVKKVGFDDCLATLHGIFRYWLDQVILPDADLVRRLAKGAP